MPHDLGTLPSVHSTKNMRDSWTLGTSTGWPQRSLKCGVCSPSVGMRSGCWWRGIGKWSMKAGSVTNLPPSRAQSGRPKPCRSCDTHGDFSSVTVGCRPESQFVPLTSSCCSIAGFRDSRRTFISDNPQCAGCRRFEACHRDEVARSMASMKSFDDCTGQRGVTESLKV